MLKHVDKQDSKSGKTICEYKLMDAVWVQLLADGSRAHAPKLRVRLLSPTHPAARASMLESRGRKHNGFVSQQYTVSDQSTRGKRGPIRADRKQMVQDKKQSLQDIVKKFAVEEALSSKASNLKGPDSLKRKGATSIYDVTEDFKRLKVASVYLDVECSGPSNMFIPDVLSPQQQEVEVSSTVCSIDGGHGFDWMPLTSGMNVSEGSLQPELWFMERLRIVWQRKLDRAAKVRATHIWSTRGNDSEKLIQSAEKEEHERCRAHVLSIWLQ